MRIDGGHGARAPLPTLQASVPFEGPIMSPDTYPSWLLWALLSAGFAALTAIFAKIGVEDINSDLATLIRTVVVLISLALILFATGRLGQTGPISTRTWIFLLLSGLGTGA